MKTNSRRRALAWVLTVGAVLLVATGPAVAEEEDGLKVKYKVGDGLSIGNEDNQVKIQGRVQARFTYDAREAAADADTFAIQRGKIKIEGFTFEKKLKFGFQMSLATRNRATTTNVCGAPTDADGDGQIDTCTPTNAVTAESTTGLAVLEDYYVDYVPYDVFGVRVGQFKAPFLHQELTSSGKQQFIDRSLSTGHFNLGRDIGAGFHGDFWEDGLGYSVFFMNGDGVNQINRNQSFMAGLRLEYPILGKYEHSESDVKHSDEPNWGVGLAYAFNELGTAFVNGLVPAGAKLSLGTLDTGFKYKGFSLQAAGMLARSHDTAVMTNYGWNVQTGYFVVPKKFEAALRGAGTVFSNATRNQYEYAAGLNYFIKGHPIKLQADYAVLLNNRGLNLNDHRFRTQLQIVF